MNIEAITGIVSAIATTATGVLAWQAASSANKAAHESAQVAKEAEQDRRWAALMPQFKYNCVAKDSNARAELRIRLDGPHILGRLDRVAVSIRDDRPDRGRFMVSGGLTAEQVANQVWGPYRFNLHVENVDKSHGRRVVFPGGVAVGEDLVCALEETLVPAESESRRWREQYAGKPVRLLIECERENLPPWRIPDEVEVIPYPATAAGSG